MTRHFWIDLLERGIWTFVQAFLGVIAGSGILDLGISALEAGAIAGLGAVASLLKSVAANRLERLGTAQLIPFARGTYSHSGPEISPDVIER